MLTPTRWLPLMVVLLSSAAEATAGERPNVLLIITDDQGYGDFSIHDNPLLRTPNIDWLAQQGMRFDRFFVSPVCAPTRASLLTGRYSLRCGVWGVTHGKETMRSEEVTLAEVLRGAGYRTAIFGKWHNGEHFGIRFVRTVTGDPETIPNATNCHKPNGCKRLMRSPSLAEFVRQNTLPRHPYDGVSRP